MVTRPEGGAETAAQIAQTAGFRARDHRDRPAALLRGGLAGSRPGGPPCDRRPVQQPGQRLAPTNAQEGATEARIALAGLGPALPLASRRLLQPFQHPAPPDRRPNDSRSGPRPSRPGATSPPPEGGPHAAWGSLLIYVTMPARVLVDLAVAQPGERGQRGLAGDRPLISTSRSAPSFSSCETSISLAMSTPPLQQSGRHGSWFIQS